MLDFHYLVIVYVCSIYVCSRFSVLLTIFYLKTATASTKDGSSYIIVPLACSIIVKVFSGATDVSGNPCDEGD